jgi:hypothetical protein
VTTETENGVMQPRIIRQGILAGSFFQKLEEARIGSSFIVPEGSVVLLVPQFQPSDTDFRFLSYRTIDFWPIYFCCFNTKRNDNLLQQL